MKKFISLLLALVLCFSLAVTASAADIETRTFRYAGNSEAYCTLEGIFTSGTTLDYVDYKGKEYSLTGITAVLDPDSPVVTNGFGTSYLNWDGSKYVENQYSGEMYNVTTAKDLFVFKGEPVDVVLLLGTESWVFLKLADTAQAPGTPETPETSEDDALYGAYVVESGYSMTFFTSAYAESAVPVYAPGQYVNTLIPLNVKSGSSFGFGGMDGFCVPIPFYKCTYNASTGTISNMTGIPLDIQYNSYGDPMDVTIEQLVSAAEGIEGNAIVFFGQPSRMDTVNSGIYSALFLVQVDGKKPVTPAIKSYPDLTDKTETFYEDIQWITAAGLMNGTSDGNFTRKGNISRQQIWRVLARSVLGKDTDGMAGAKQWAIENGVSDGSRPGDFATREEMVTMMWLAYGQPSAIESNVLTRFPDADRVSADCRAAMEWAVENGIVSGTKAGTLDPTGLVTRGAFAAIMHRYLGK